MLSLVERSVVFLTPENIVPVPRDCSWLRTVWHDLDQRAQRPIDRVELCHVIRHREQVRDQT